MFPGWRARVDGLAAPVLTADGAFLGVPVPLGDHHVTLTYEKPVIALVGGGSPLPRFWASPYSCSSAEKEARCDRPRPRRGRRLH